MEQAFKKRNLTLLLLVAYLVTVFCVALLAFPVTKETESQSPLALPTLPSTLPALPGAHTLLDEAETKGSRFLLLEGEEGPVLAWIEMFPLFNRGRLRATGAPVSADVAFTANDFFERVTVRQAGGRLQIEAAPRFCVWTWLIYGLGVALVVLFVRAVTAYEAARQQEDPPQEGEQAAPKWDSAFGSGFRELYGLSPKEKKEP